MSRLILGLMITATIMIGLLTGGNFDRATVAMPAWHAVGWVAWADFSRQADLGNGLLVYPIMAIGGTAITVVAAVLLVLNLKSHKARGATAPVLLASTFALVSLPVSFKATPYMLSLRHVTDGDLDALARAFSGYERWGRLQGLCHLACFFALVWGMAAHGRRDASTAAFTQSGAEAEGRASGGADEGRGS